MALAEYFADRYLGEVVKVGEGKKPLVNILEFAEREEFLNLRLYPVQRFILKLLFNVKLKEKLQPKDIIVLRDKFNEREDRSFSSEVKFRDFLYAHGHLNSKTFQYPIIEGYLVMGRRGSKTTLTSIIAAYKLYIILSHYDPQRYFELVEDSEIGVLICSNTKGNARKQYQALANLIYRCHFFKPFLYKEDVDRVGGQEFKLRTQKFNDTKKGGLVVVSVNAVNPSLRGGNNVLVIADEYAHYIDSEKSTKEKPLDRLMYEAATPSLASFVTPTGEAFGSAYFVTSPNGRKGRTWDVVGGARDREDEIVLNMPSWWVNERLSTDFLKKMWKESEISFRQEYGAEVLSVSLGSWVKRVEFFVNSTCERLKVGEFSRLAEGARHFAAVDLALSSDGAVIAVCHLAKSYIRENKVHDDALMANEDIVVFDYIYYEYPRDDKPIRISSIVDKMLEVRRVYKLDSLYLDNWSSQMFTQYLEDMGRSNKEYIRLREIIKVVNTTQTLNSDWARMFRSVLIEGRMAYPNDTTLLEQLSGLREKVVGGHVKVENTTGHDDIPNAMFKACYYCSLDKDVSVVKQPSIYANIRAKRDDRGFLEARMRKGNNFLNMRRGG